MPAPLPTLLPALVPTLLPALVPTLLPALVPAAWLPLGALLGFAGLVVLQLLPGLGPNGGALSIDPFHTRRYLLTTLLYLGGWLLVLLTVNTRERAEKLLAALLAAGVNNDGLLPLPLRSTR